MEKRAEAVRDNGLGRKPGMKLIEKETTVADVKVIAEVLENEKMYEAKVWFKDGSVIVEWYGSVSEHNRIDGIVYNAGYALASTITYEDIDWWGLCDIGHRFVRVEVVETN